ncbi:MAG: hypothetical protein Q4E91_13285 [Lachnospiraceae bacterium]|nr:hypothetical protein [Lachnospiraceae bacterium]
MQIQLVIGEQDSRYLNNLLLFLEKNHMDKLEIFSFSRSDMLQEYFSNRKADVILVDERFGIEAESLKSFGKVAYLCDSVSEPVSDGIRRIAKYKKPDLIYKDILDLYAESGNRGSFQAKAAGTGNMVLVTSFSGGVGASTFAVALAKKYASRGKKTLYLNLETVGSSADFFSGTGNYRFEDVIFALKSQRTDVRLKMESAVRVDKSGVAFFEPCSTAMYMLELTTEDIVRIVDVLELARTYEYVVVDINFQLSKEFLEIMKRMDRVILVADGTETANTKFVRTLQALSILESQTKSNVTGNMSVVYNKFSSSKSSSEIPELRMPVIGKLPPVKHALVHEIVDFMLSRQEIFEKLS